MAKSGGSRRPRQSDLRRAVSTTYYALFHQICRNNADLLIGGKSANRSDPAWRQAYRSVNHGHTRKACGNRTVMSRFPTEIEDFAYEFVQAQIKRHDADYNPLPFAPLSSTDGQQPGKGGEEIMRKSTKKDRAQVRLLAVLPRSKRLDASAKRMLSRLSRNQNLERGSELLGGLFPNWD